MDLIAINSRRIGAQEVRTVKHKRKSLSKRLRFNVFKRDGFTCQYCGAHPPMVILHVDHIVPVVEGGSNDIDNLVASCEPCNIGKGGVSLTVVPQSLSEKAKEVKEREEQINGYEAVMAGKRARIDGDAWKLMGLFYPGQDSVPRDSFMSTKKFIERLGFDEALEAAEIALVAPTSSQKMFRYFCGVCWNKIRAHEGTSA